jgi:hypothetical protein
MATPQLFTISAASVETGRDRRTISGCVQLLEKRRKIFQQIAGNFGALHTLLTHMNEGLPPHEAELLEPAADKAKNRIKQALGEIGCDVFIETDR